MRSDLQKSLIGPSFAEAERTKKIQKKKEKIDTSVRVKQLSSGHALSVKFHASRTHFTRQQRRAKFVSIQACLEDSLFILFQKIILLFKKREKIISL